MFSVQRWPRRQVVLPSSVESQVGWTQLKMMLALAAAAQRPKEKREGFIGTRSWPNQDGRSEHRTLSMQGVKSRAKRQARDGGEREARCKQKGVMGSVGDGCLSAWWGKEQVGPANHRSTAAAGGGWCWRTLLPLHNRKGPGPLQPSGRAKISCCMP